MSATQRTDSLDREYPGEAASLRDARHDTTRWLQQQGFDDDTRQRAALVVSELASNAVEAAPGTPYSLTVSNEPGRSVVTVEVRNRGSVDTSLAPVAGLAGRATMAPPSASRGRGLAIVGTLAQDVTVEQRHDTVVVVARLPAGRA